MRRVTLLRMYKTKIDLHILCETRKSQILRIITIHGRWINEFFHNEYEDGNCEHEEARNIEVKKNFKTSTRSVIL